VGSVVTRRSNSRPPAVVSGSRPSWERRRSPMSRPACTFRREIVAGAIASVICPICRRAPSILTRTDSPASQGTKWRSLAPASAARRMRDSSAPPSPAPTPSADAFDGEQGDAVLARLPQRADHVCDRSARRDDELDPGTGYLLDGCAPGRVGDRNLEQRAL